MIKAVRLRIPDKNMNWRIKRYTSAKHKQYRTGNAQVPPMWYVVEDKEEIKELSKINQFEIREFGSLDDLNKLIQYEFEMSVRGGIHNPVKAVIQKGGILMEKMEIEQKEKKRAEKEEKAEKEDKRSEETKRRGRKAKEEQQ